MKVTYDPSVDMMLIELNERYPFTTDSKTVPGLAIMYDEHGKVCAIEIEDASQLVNAPNHVDFEVFTQANSEKPQTVLEGEHGQSE